MRVVLATSNKGKINEIQTWLNSLDTPLVWEAVAYDQLCPPFEIEETGKTFQENAYIKAQAVFDALGGKEIVLADDSGISIESLGGAPGIYSARFSGENSTDQKNIEKVVALLREKGVTTSSAYYTAAMALVFPEGKASVHGWMYGDVIVTPKGDKGFGYDPIFIPEGHTLTLGELDDEIKLRLSHRTQALQRCAKVIVWGLW